MRFLRAYGDVPLERKEKELYCCCNSSDPNNPLCPAFPKKIYMK